MRRLGVLPGGSWKRKSRPLSARWFLRVQSEVDREDLIERGFSKVGLLKGCGMKGSYWHGRHLCRPYLSVIFAGPEA